ncbi:MAG: acyl-CoA dehydrogenase family protein [Burkholderiaceae bacterium]|nr:acyl-CoA dehydrogenase family protein [Burkholderiaceae bacterium]
MNHQPNTDDIQFILHNVLQAPAQLQALAPFADTDADLMAQVIDEAGKFVADKIAPLQRVGDEVGCRFDGGTVTTPPGFKEAYAEFWQSGWAALSCAPEDGGQGLPEALNQVLYEMLSAANHGWTMAPGLLHGAYECIRHHASPELKAAYLSKVASGEWLATMCLTEAHAGSDLGLVRTRAVPDVAADGQGLGTVHRLNGTKIFISGGEHDLTDNIVHLVLARLPDAPPGPKGLSLFLAPKWLPNGKRNTVVCERIEEKMGLHGSATCVLRFDEATGWLVGEPGKGLGAMFVMMNAARLHVGLQGVGLLEAAWQKADAYARERRQMRAPGPRQGNHEADFIIAHPAMRRILDTQRAWVDGGRVLAYRTAVELDMARHHPDDQRRQVAQRWCSLVTPVLKAAWTDQAFHGGSDCLQVFGGHGYVSEWGIEQILRDARITMIYEGTNEIQAIDLLVRKVLADQGQALHALVAELLADLATAATTTTAIDCGGASAPTCAGAATTSSAHMAADLLTRLGQAATALCQRHTTAPEHAHWVAGDFLRATALALLAWSWARIGRTQGADTPRWRQPEQALHAWVLPEFELRQALLHQVAVR